MNYTADCTDYRMLLSFNFQYQAQKFWINPSREFFPADSSRAFLNSSQLSWLSRVSWNCSFILRSLHPQAVTPNPVKLAKTPDSGANPTWLLLATMIRNQNVLSTFLIFKQSSTAQCLPPNTNILVTVFIFFYLIDN